MNMDAFKRLDERYRSERPELFRLSASDKPATRDQLHYVEQAIGVKLPQSYRSFLEEFGGGCFGLLTIFSADPEGEWYLPTKLAEARTFVPQTALPFSDDFAGGYYVLTQEDGVALEPVFYWNADGGTTRTEFESVLDFIARYAYEPA